MSNNVKRYASEEYVDKQNTDVSEKIDALSDISLIKNEQALTQDEVNQVRINLHNVGQYATGLTYYSFNVVEILDYDDFTKELLDPVVALQGAEIYNDYENNIATGMWAVASGCSTQALGDFSDASGWLTKATGFCSIASGRQTLCSGNYSHSEGHSTQATANDSHAEDALIANEDLQRAKVVYRKDSDGYITVSRCCNENGQVHTNKKQIEYVAVPEELRLGCYRSNVNGTGRFAKGILNECKIYNVALSDEQITEFLTL